MKSIIKTAEMQNRNQARADQGQAERKEKMTTGSEDSKGEITDSPALEGMLVCQEVSWAREAGSKRSLAAEILHANQGPLHWERLCYGNLTFPSSRYQLYSKT